MTKYIKISNIFKALSHPYLKILEDTGIIKKIKKDNNVLCELKYEKIIDIINQVDYIIKKEIDLSMEIMKK